MTQLQYKNIDFIKIFDFQHKNTIFKPKPKSEWDKRAEDFDKNTESPYYDAFMSKISLNNVNSVLDIGCGNGNLAVRFLQKGLKVTGMDYSPGMIESFKKNTAKYGNVKSFIKAWEDNWDDVEVHDIAVVSRSFEFTNISVKEALDKLLAHVKKAVYMTYYVGNYLDDEILNFLEKDIINRPEYILLLNVLYQMGIEAKVDFIEAEKPEKTVSFEDFLRKVEWKLGELNKNDTEKLKEFYEMKKAQNKPPFRPMKWAYIYWEIPC